MLSVDTNGVINIGRGASQAQFSGSFSSNHGFEGWSISYAVS
jgi:hypothetical protein